MRFYFYYVSLSFAASPFFMEHFFFVFVWRGKLSFSRAQQQVLGGGLRWERHVLRKRARNREHGKETDALEYFFFLLLSSTNFKNYGNNFFVCVQQLHEILYFSFWFLAELLSLAPLLKLGYFLWMKCVHHVQMNVVPHCVYIYECFLSSLFLASYVAWE